MLYNISVQFCFSLIYQYPITVVLSDPGQCAVLTYSSTEECEQPQSELSVSVGTWRETECNLRVGFLFTSAASAVMKDRIRPQREGVSQRP
ncbi:hypothetical protein MHYP_G00062360 [Metynnis hypsauchen]